jgi:hypothetical protein
MRFSFSPRRWGLFGLAALAFCLPFEMRAAWLSAGPFQFTNVELLLCGLFGLALWILVSERRSGAALTSVLPTRWLWLWGLFSIGLSLSVLMAPEYRLNALKASVRYLAGFGLAGGTSLIVRDQKEQTAIVLGLLGGGSLAAALGLAEMVRGFPFEWMTLFRFVPTMVGPFMRLTGPFDHANEAAMFIEATLPFFVVAAWVLWNSARRSPAVMMTVAGLIYLEAGFLTYSRSLFATIFLSSMLIVGLYLSCSALPLRMRAFLWPGLAGLIVLFFVAHTLLSFTFRLRLGNEGDAEWYRASFSVPSELSMPASGREEVTVRIENRGVFTWSSAGENPVNLGMRWRRRADNRLLPQEPRWPLPHEVAPGEEITLAVSLEAPSSPGDYELEWDMVQENVAWFSSKTGMVMSSRVTVLPTAASLATQENAGRPASPMEAVSPTQVFIPDRRVLWSIAWGQFLSHPLFGVGLDNFRLTYGRALGWPVWNQTIHTNNWYIELLASLGLVGSMPFFVWLADLAMDIARRMRQPGVTLWQLALGIGLLAYMIHGLTDYFLLSNTTGLLFWLLAGLWIANCRFQTANSS